LPLISPLVVRAWPAIFLRRLAVLACLAGLAGFAPRGTAAVELVFAPTNGPAADSLEKDGREIKLDGPDGLVAIPLEGRWALRGDLKSALAKINWSPACSVGRLTRWRFSAGSQSACQALVTLTAGAPGGWSIGQLKGAIAVFVWLRQGQIVAVTPVPIRPAYLGRDQVVASAKFGLSEREAEGAPIVLLLRGREFVAPAAAWTEPARALLAAAFLAGPPGTDAAVAPAEASRLIEVVAGAGHARLAATLLARHGAALSADQDFAIFAAAGRGGRIAAARAILAAVGPRLAPRKLGEFLEELLVNGQDELASDTVGWMHRADRKVPGADELARIALQRGQPRATAALAGAALPQLLAKEGAKYFSGIAAVDNPQLLRLLLANGVQPARVDPDSLALGQAAAVGDRAKVQLLLAAGANPDPAHASAAAPLLHAARGGDATVIALLLAAGAKVDRLNPLAGAGQTDTASEAGSAAAETVTALEVALLRLDRAAVETLTHAGARLDPHRPRFAALLEAAIAIDQPAIVEAALHDGWNPAQPLAGDWNAETVAAAYGANRCLAWLHGQAPAPTKPVIFYSDLENRPKLLTPDFDADLRSTLRAHPRAEVTVRGTVDQTGALRCVTVEGTADEELRVGLRSAAANFRFKPARRGGAPVCVRISLPLLLAAVPRREFAANDVDLPALQTKPAITLARIMDAGVGDAGGGAAADEFGPEGDPREMGNEPMPLVRFLVDLEGRARDATVLWSRDRLDREGALRNLAKYRFAPAIAGGRTVLVTLTQRISPL
jgi:hypothetical protein